MKNALFILAYALFVVLLIAFPFFLEHLEHFAFRDSPPDKSLEEVYQQEIEDTYESGKTDGYELGKEEAYKDGFEDGYDEGYLKGMDDNYEKMQEEVENSYLSGANDCKEQIIDYLRSMELYDIAKKIDLHFSFQE